MFMYEYQAHNPTFESSLYNFSVTLILKPISKETCSWLSKMQVLL